MTAIKIYIAITIFACTFAALATFIRAIARKDRGMFVTAAVEAALPLWGVWLLFSA